MAKKRILKGMLIKTDGSEPEVVELEYDGTLKPLYELLEVDMIEIPHLLIEGKNFEVYCDEEALLKSYPISTIAFKSLFGSGCYIYGNVFIVASNNRSLNDGQIEILKKRIKKTYNDRYILDAR